MAPPKEQTQIFEICPFLLGEDASYWDVTGIGNEKKGSVYRGVSYSTSEIQRRYLSIVVNDAFAQPALDAIINASKTDEVGDGKIFVSTIDQAYRIRTGEKGGDSLN